MILRKWTADLEQIAESVGREYLFIIFAAIMNNIFFVFKKFF